MVELKPILLPSKHSMAYIKFFAVLIVTVLIFPILSDVTPHILYVLVDNNEIPKDVFHDVFHDEMGQIIEMIVIGWLFIWSIKKSVEIYNDIIQLIIHLKFRKATSLYNPSNKSPIHLKKRNKKPT